MRYLMITIYLKDLVMCSGWTNNSLSDHMIAKVAPGSKTRTLIKLFRSHANTPAIVMVAVEESLVFFGATRTMMPCSFSPLAKT